VHDLNIGPHPSHKPVLAYVRVPLTQNINPHLRANPNHELSEISNDDAAGGGRGALGFKSSVVLICWDAKVRIVSY
jgi:hypothetical protein